MAEGLHYHNHHCNHLHHHQHGQWIATARDRRSHRRSRHHCRRRRYPCFGAAQRTHNPVTEMTGGAGGTPTTPGPQETTRRDSPTIARGATEIPTVPAMATTTGTGTELRRRATTIARTLALPTRNLHRGRTTLQLQASTEQAHPTTTTVTAATRPTMPAVAAAAALQETGQDHIPTPAPPCPATAAAVVVTAA